MIPVIDLAAVAGCKPATGLNILLITEYARSAGVCCGIGGKHHASGLKQVHAAENRRHGRYITSIACPDEKTDTNDLAMVLDVEQILHDITPANHDPHATHLETTKFNIKPGSVAIVAEDSPMARSMLEKGLQAMESRPAAYHRQDAWENHSVGRSIFRLRASPLPIRLPCIDRPRNAGDGRLYADAQNQNRPGTERYSGGDPLVSLSGNANEDHIRKVKADGYMWRSLS